MTRILILKTAALGDVLRTTSILPGLAACDPEIEVTWVTAPGARPLVEHHPLVVNVETVDPSDAEAMGSLRERLAGVRWERVLSFDDEQPMCTLASAMDTASLSGAYAAADGSRVYSDDSAPWFDMGLISRFGKERADALKIENTRSHPEIYAAMLGIETGRPELPLDDGVVTRTRAFAVGAGLADERLVVGLNTGAGGRWRTKGLPPERVELLASCIADRLDEAPSFLVLGGPAEAERNVDITSRLAASGHHAVDAGTGNPLLDFAARVGLSDLLITSDSMALHMGIARSVPMVAFFAPTSAAEIELYGLGEKVASTAPDYCSYRPDADNVTLTPERITDAAMRVLERSGWRAQDRSGR
ncbi:MAG: glycosyltransferase family 9 protein [bacterium]|nr:glycosyltransferase family 9 protein [bacterium]